MKKISVYLEEYQIEALRQLADTSTTPLPSAELVRLAIDKLIPLSILNNARAVVEKRKIATLRMEGSE